jgi:3-hydroxyisobutyrate dehydrogenase
VSERPTIAILGTGTIGKPVASNLARAGFSLRAWNRTRTKAAFRRAVELGHGDQDMAAVVEAVARAAAVHR